MNNVAGGLASSRLSLIAARRLSAPGLFAFGVLLAGCGNDTPKPTSEQGGDSSSAAGSGGSASSSGGNSTNGGETETNAGAPAVGGMVTNAGAPSGDAGAAGSGTDEPVTGGDGLGAADGITGTFAGMAHTATFNALHVPQQTSTAVIGATTAMYAPYDSWRVRFVPELGTQSCNGGTGPDDPAIDFGSFTNLAAAGTTADKTCSITVTSLAPKFEGTFTATLGTSGGDVVVTEGAFRVPN